MRKLLVAVFVVGLFAPAAFAEFGLGLKLGGIQNEDKVVDFVKDNYSNYDTKENYGLFGVEVLYEVPGLFTGNKNHAFGAKLGADFLGMDEAETYTPRTKVEINTFKIPLTVYYKYMPETSKVHFWVGAGISFINTTFDDKGGDEKSYNEVFPHIKGGVEYRFTKVFALGLDLGYNFGGKVKWDQFNDMTGLDVYRDNSGFEGALAARFYF